MIRFTSSWYYVFYKKLDNMMDKTIEQINEYENLAVKKGMLWTE